ncbi:uncharacterized protein BYT42DRAFT_554022 [Radiomyces spectabilis]|uniref:uncharacterized protein n=1 Tax=Radiomyces spectabilis TaxID=64574 RepID=UPI00221EF942|nr:uncharacterized protein BYT42DRAFT_554022 [Radiomyces spectabilis]KAI8394274.1 hypothetical protein BYT42DRAFT_554022 [Radiomyces spectabilis]
MPSTINSGLPSTTDGNDMDLQKWLKEIENAENLMDDVEAKTSSLQAKVDALLAQLMNDSESSQSSDDVTKQNASDA